MMMPRNAGCALDTAFAMAAVQPQGTVVLQPPAPAGPSLAAGWTNGPPTCLDLQLGPSLVPGEPGTAPVGWSQAWARTPQPFTAYNSPGEAQVPPGDYAGILTDPYTGIRYASYTRAMPEPIIPRGGDMSLPTAEARAANGAAASLALEAMTGNSALTTKPCRQEMSRDWADALEGAKIPTPLLQQTVNAAVAASAARDTYFVNREVAKPLPETQWAGYIGTSYVLRVREDTQTVQSYDGGGTDRLPDRIPAPDLTLPVPMPQDPTGLGGPLAPLRRILARDKVTQPGRPTADDVENAAARLQTAVGDGLGSARLVDYTLTAGGAAQVPAGPSATSGLLPPQSAQDRGNDGVLGALHAMATMQQFSPQTWAPATATEGGAKVRLGAPAGPVHVGLESADVMPTPAPGPASAVDGRGAGRLGAGGEVVTPGTAALNWQSHPHAPNASLPSALPDAHTRQLLAGVGQALDVGGVGMLPAGMGAGQGYAAPAAAPAAALDGLGRFLRADALPVTSAGLLYSGQPPAAAAPADGGHNWRKLLSEQCTPGAAHPQGLGGWADPGLGPGGLQAAVDSGHGVRAPTGALRADVLTPQGPAAQALPVTAYAGLRSSMGGTDLGADLRVQVDQPNGALRGAGSAVQTLPPASFDGTLRATQQDLGAGGRVNVGATTATTFTQGLPGVSSEQSAQRTINAAAALGAGLRTDVQVLPGHAGQNAQPGPAAAGSRLRPNADGGPTLPVGGVQAHQWAPAQSLTPEYSQLAPAVEGLAPRVAGAQVPESTAPSAWGTTWDGTRAARHVQDAFALGVQRVGPVQVPGGGGQDQQRLLTTSDGAGPARWFQGEGVATRPVADMQAAGTAGAYGVNLPTAYPVNVEGTRAARTYIGLGATTDAARSRTLFWADGPQGYASLPAHPSKDRGDTTNNTADKLLQHTSLLREVLLAAHPATGPTVNATYLQPRETGAAVLAGCAIRQQDLQQQLNASLLDRAIAQQQALGAALASQPVQPLCDVGYESDY